MIAEYPLHRLNTGQARAWLMIPAMRRQMAEWLGKNYKTGCVVLTPELRAFAKVSPSGRVTALKWPYRKFLFHQIANKPSLIYGECACRNFWDPESGGAWGDRDDARKIDLHHPMCQGREVSMAVFERSYQSAVSRASVAETLPDGTKRLVWKQNPQTRPDEWIRTAKELES